MRTIPIAAILLLAALAGCLRPQDDAAATPTPTSPATDADAPPACVQTAQATGGPGGQSVVVNEPGSFSYSGQAAAKSATEVYLWENAARSAQLSWAGQSGSGSLTLTIVDPCGEEVYRRTLDGAFQGQTATTEASADGAPGLWALTFEFELFTGQMGLQISSTS